MASASRASEPPVDRATAVAEWVRRWLLALLVAAYAAATFAPAPGVWLRDLGIEASGDAAPVAVAPIRFSLVMVGVLLLCGALSIDARKLRELTQRPVGLLLALVSVWGPALLLVAAWGRLAPLWLAPADAAALVVGLALAGAMPVANSAVAWTHQSGGSLVWALGLVVVSISLCPWLTPWLLTLWGLAPSGADAASAGLVVSQFTGAVFGFWVLGPTLLGLTLRWACGARAIDAARPWLTIVSAAALLLLNYANAAAALPRVFAEPRPVLLLTTLAAAATLPLGGALLAAPMARLAGLSRPGRVAWAYSLGMKNTGMALGLAGATLGDLPTAVLVILAVTLLQHAVAGAVHAVSCRKPPAEPTDG